MIPHHCMGCVWSRRDKKKMYAPSVFATVNQFNKVSYRVIATVLKHPLDIRRPDRAKIIEKWIEIAQVRIPCTMLNATSFAFHFHILNMKVGQNVETTQGIHDSAYTYISDLFCILNK